jgi:protein O-GlcNAc transferase
MAPFSQLLQQAGAFCKAGQWSKAEQVCRSLLKAQPDNFEALNLMGIIASQTQRNREAAELIMRAISIRPDQPVAHHTLGNVLLSLQRPAEALDSIERALQLNPNDAGAYNDRGNALRNLNRFEAALDSYERALAIRQDYAEAWHNRGVMLGLLKRFVEALDSYERALKLNPNIPWLYGVWLHTKAQLCDWSDLDSQVAELGRKLEQGKRITLPFPTLALVDSPALHRQAAEIWLSANYPSNPSPPPIEKRRHDKIRIGYYSADFHAHATAYLTAGLFECHDREGFHLVAFSFGPDNQDEMRMRLSAAFDQFVDVRAKSDKEVAQLSRELEIDIAVDLKGFTKHGRAGIFSHRAAPIQLNYLGYPGTMGASFIDYIIADPIVIPRDSRHRYVEKIAYLPDSYQVNDRRRPIAAKGFSRSEAGLPAEGFIFCCFNKAYKITPSTFSCWMRILKQVEGSILWLLEDSPTAAVNLRRQAAARGVDPERLIFAPHMPAAEHLARHRAADLFVDTLPYNAHTTASDALWAGLPILTRTGDSFASRVCASLLRSVGLPELVTSKWEQYEAMAIELATHPGRLSGIRDRLDRNRLTTPLFDTQAYTRHLENAFLQMHQRYQSGLNPEHIFVPA